MITPQILKEILAENTAEISEIKRKVVVVTDDELVEFLSNHSEDDNILLMAVLPSYSGYGEEDNAGAFSFMQFFFLEKVDYGDFRNQDEYIAVFQRTLTALMEFLRNLLESNACSREELQRDFKILPVSRKAQCNGYELQIDAKLFTEF